MAQKQLRISRAKLESYSSKDVCYVTIGDAIYDVTGFLEDHPGGADLVLEYAGKDVKEIMEDELSHSHSESAYEILDERRVGTIMEDDHEYEQAVEAMDEIPSKPIFEATGLSSAEDLSKDTDASADYKKHKFLDLDRPLFPQLLFGNFSREFYLEQVHRPRHYSKGPSAPLFGNFLEPLSKTAWWVIPLVWLPPVAYGSWLGFTNLSTVRESVSYWFLGLFLWTLVEYGLHRFLFHVDKILPDNSVALTTHFLLHGIHHYLPMDRYRLVMPPTLFLVLAYPFYRLAHFVFSWDYYVATTVFSGGIFGYICYDLSHYFLHHKNLPSYYKELKKYHLAHHYQNYELGFGVTSKFWDKLFGTQLEYVKPVKGA